MKISNRYAIATCIAIGLIAQNAIAQQSLPTLQKIQQSGTIAIGHRETSVPFSYLDANNQVVGFSQDLCNHVIDAVKPRRSALTSRCDLFLSRHKIVSRLCRTGPSILNAA